MQIRALLVAGLALVVFACVPSPMAVDLDATSDAPLDTAGDLDAAPDLADALDLLDALDLPEADLGKDQHTGDADVTPDADVPPDTDADCCAALDCEAQLGESTTCRLVTCDPETCACEATDQTGACDDASACTTNDTCVDGACKGTAVAVDDQLTCTDDACDPATGNVSHTLKIGACLLPNAAEVLSCYLSDDLKGDAGADSCWACKPFKDAHAWSPNAGFGCDDLNPCTINDKCGGDGGCTGNDLGDLCICDNDAKCLTLDDGNLCNGVPTCNEETSKCEIAAGAVVTCDPAGDTYCRQNKCQPETGACAYKPLHETELCDDANACTSGETCTAGACLGDPTPIDDGLSCTDDTCDVATGEVSHVLVLGFCRIVDAGTPRCVADGLLHADNVCLYCDTGLDAEDWSNNDGAACDAGAGTLEGVCVGGLCVAKGDIDGDGVADELDNCPSVANVGQENADGDTTGDACDDDDDNDGALDATDCKPLDAAIHPGAPEACNGLDDDCDNATDQADPGLDLPACDKQVGVCAGANKPASLCVEGAWKPCTAGTYLDHDERYQPGSELSCDDADNNCDGVTDEGFTYLGMPPGTDCTGSGGCGQGLVECAPDGKSALCSTNPGGSQYEPKAETCNGVDDDCDGQTDEGLGVLDSDCRLVGACAPSNVLATCDGSGWVCDYSSVPGYQQAQESICDDIDNDCDGQTDEDFAWIIDGHEYEKGDACGSGACQGGVMICDQAGELVCSTDLGDVELCDGKDNDCDGQTDEDLVYVDPKSGTSYALGTPCQGRGECGTGQVECGSKLVATCSTNADGSASQAEDERCDGLDNDCDDATDEGITWNGLALGDACEGTGECGAGTVECSLYSDGATCSTNWDGSATEVVPEQCNALDDDCSGTVDDELTVWQSNCKLTGVCTPQEVVATCNGTTGWTCSYAAIPDYVEGSEAGRCDGKDNDCDGATDEDFSWSGLQLGASCDGPDADTCARGTVACAAGGATAECVGDVAQVESCNGKDDDCDGVTDEANASDCTTWYRDNDADTWGGTETACLCAADTAGHFTATRGGDCNDALAAVNPDAAETCNGKDDDCDTKTDAADPGLATGDVQSCENQKGVCAGATKPVSLCQAGTWSPCTPAIYATFSASYQSGAEMGCDAKDNDCDGATDEDFSLTLPDGATVSGVAKPCGAGVCTGGQTQCTPAANAIECSTSYLAVTEVCNTFDDDCDGKTDAQESTLAETDPRTCEKQQGVCAGSKKPTVLCVAGAWAACADAQYQSYSPSYEAGTELHCDGKDNDCNGQTDEDFPLTLLDGTTVTGAGKTCGVGVCANGTTACEASTLGIRCPSEAGAVTEVCDTKDNDCDGKTDKNDPTLELSACEKQAGVCAGSKHVASQCGAGSWTPCTTAEYTAANPEYEATTELSCDNLDNDCDGTVDDDFTWQDPNDGKTKKKGDACGTGACAGSVVICKADGTGLLCSESSGLEVCGDGVDNDCDGKTDEEGAQNCTTYYKDADRDTFGKTADLKCLCAADAAAFYDTTKSGDCDDSKVGVNPDAPETCDAVDNDCDTKTDASDPDLATDDVKACENQKGVCSGSKKPVTLCGSGMWQACSTATYQAYSTSYQTPAETKCDAKDNDCDGTVDDDFQVTTPDGTTYAGIGKPCGTGTCAGGATQCKTDQSGIECSTSWKAVAETCDKVDNDCDAKTDANDPSLTLPTCEKQAGVCSGSTKPASLCGNGAWGSCTDAIYAAYSADYQVPAETACDGLDNNCDYDVDHEFIATTPDGSFYYGPGQACGKGVCTGGVTRCTTDKLHLECSTTGLPPYTGLAPERCNGLDDDCDTKTDASDPDLATADPQLCEKQSGVCAGTAKPPTLCVGGAWQTCTDAIYTAHDAAYTPFDRVGGRCFGWEYWALQGSLPDVANAGVGLRVRADDLGALDVVSADSVNGTIVLQRQTSDGIASAGLISNSVVGANSPAFDLQGGSDPVAAFLADKGTAVWVTSPLDASWSIWITEPIITGAVGQFSSPAVVATDDGKVQVAWIDKSSGLWGTTKRPGGTWESPAHLVTGAIGEVVAKRDALGRTHLLYTSGAGSRGTLTHLQVDSRGATTRTVLADASDLIGIDLAIDADNVLHMTAWDDGAAALYYANDSTGAWVAEVVSYDDDARSPRLAISAEGRAIISATHTNLAGGPEIVLWTNATSTWQWSTPDTSVWADESGLAFVSGTLYVAYHDQGSNSTRLASAGCSRAGDARDENCDGLDGVDADHDGYGDQAYLGTDCADTTAAIHPGATDSPGDSKDTNCDHADGTDADHDRFAASAGTFVADCNDANAAVNPAAYERCNLVDDNCSGQTDAADPKLSAQDPQWCEKQAGVCSGSTKPNRLCVAGAWTACDDAAYDAYDPLFDPVDVLGDRCITWVGGGGGTVATGAGYNAALAYDTTGTPHVVYRDGITKALLFATPNATGGWSTTTIDTLGVWPAMAYFGSEIHVVYRRNTTTGVFFSKSLDGGATWSTPESVSSAAASGVSLVLRVDRFGNDHVAFLETTNKISYYAVRVRGGWNVATIGTAETASPALGLAVDADQHYHVCIETTAGDLVYATNKTGSQVGTVIASGGVTSCDLELDAEGGVHVAYGAPYVSGGSAARLMYTTSTTGWTTETLFTTNGNIDTSPDLLIYDKRHVVVAFNGGNVSVPNWNVLTIRNTTGAWVLDNDIPAKNIGTPVGRLRAAWNPAVTAGSTAPVEDFGIVMYNLSAGALKYLGRDCDDYSWTGDENCDGVDGTDADGDGVASRATYGADCDDAAKDISPLAADVCDYVDNDCDGVTDEYSSKNLTKESAAADGAGYTDAVSFLDSTYGVTHYAAGKKWPVVAFRNRTPGSLWSTTVLDTSDRGALIAAVVDPYNGLHTAYRDTTNNKLIYSYKAAWTAPTATTIDDLDAGCLSISLAVDPYGYPHISYQTKSSTVPIMAARLGYARLTATGWVRETVDGTTINKSGSYSSIRLVNGDTPVIAYYRNSASLAALAIRTGGTWTSYTVDASSGAGQSIGLAVANDTFHVAYRDSASKLRYAYATFAAPSTWKRTLIDSNASDTDSGLGVQIEADRLGGLHVLGRASRFSSTYLDYWVREPDVSTWSRVGAFDSGGLGTSFGLALDGVSAWPLASWGRTNVTDAWFGTLSCQ